MLQIWHQVFNQAEQLFKKEMKNKYHSTSHSSDCTLECGKRVCQKVNTWRRVGQGSCNTSRALRILTIFGQACCMCPCWALSSICLGVSIIDGRQMFLGFLNNNNADLNIKSSSKCVGDELWLKICVATLDHFIFGSQPTFRVHCLSL